ncbi:mitochondrial ribonuclease P catalytic subunit [Terrapene carolina triunguis]|uniref:Mitochondrial ribonuclease P catalytic subunit n=1 Tax=Terrapene triunguis TaxID=2587831 RepID=A0A674IXR7_9SAUR|nr:mitochondrial ribonuclease P catalytic subunit [Terrapene carolina triunguis]
MAFFRPTSFSGLQTLGKYPMFWPVPRCQRLFAVIFHLPNRKHVKCFPFTTTSQSAIPVDPKVTHMLSTKTRSKGRDGEEKEGRARGDTSSPHPFSLFSAGAAKRRSKNQEELLMISKKNGIRPPEKPLSVAEWEELRGEFKGISKFEDIMLEQMIKCNSSIDVAKSLLSMVAMRKGDISYNLLVKYLALCVRQEQMAEVYDVYDIMKVRFKTLETGAYSLLIKGLSGSNRWREALSLLEEIKKVMTPSKGNYGDCIKGALNNQEINLACELYHEMLAKGLIPNLDTLQVVFDTGKCVKDDQLNSELLGILLYLRENQLYPGEALMQSIKLWFESIPGEKWEGHLTTIKNSGKCPVCNQNLEAIHLSQEEYNALKEKIIKDVIQGTDTFRKTTPQELEEFQNFVGNHSPYDIVIDGLNVANVSKKRNQSQTLLDVVFHLAQQNVRLLVLGRKHMLTGSHSWKRHMVAAMQKKADFFFAENVSEDDPFLLYATLHSGSHCKFLTRDLLRDHKACLPDSLTRHLFFKWQRGHQMVLSHYWPGKRITFQPILTYDTVVQTTGDTWHIPYDDQLVERYSYEVPTKWLCLQRK